MQRWIRVLINLYRNWKLRRLMASDPLLSLRGSGKHLWADEHADEYVQRLRQN